MRGAINFLTAQASAGGSALSKCQRSKQWHTGVPFWWKVRESILHWVGLDSSVGVAFVDLLPYDDKLQHSILAMSQVSGSKVQRSMVVSPIWAKTALVAGADDVDSARVEEFIRKSCRRFACSLAKAGSLALEGVDIQKFKESQKATCTPPTYNMNRFKMCCPNASGFLPLRQDFLDVLQDKVKTKDHKLSKIIADHNKAVNPSGVPYKGEKKRTFEDPATSEQEEAMVVEPEVNGPRSKADFANDDAIDGGTQEYDLYVKDGKLYVLAHEDCIVSDASPLVFFWGEYLCGQEKKKDIARSKGKGFHYAITSMDFLASFTLTRASDKGAASSFPLKPSKLGRFLYHLEEENFSGFSVECHTLTEETRASNGDAEKCGYAIQVAEECIFLPKQLPQKQKVTKLTAGSAMDFSEWNFPQGTHSLGRLHFVMGLDFDEAENSIRPSRPGVWLTKPIKLRKATAVLLG